MESRSLPPDILEASAEGSGVAGVNFPLRLEPNATALYGRGQVKPAYRGHAIRWHTGNMPGQAATMLRVPNSKVGVFIALNDGSGIGSPFMAAVRQRILDDLLGLKPIEDYEQKYLRPKPTPAAAGDMSQSQALSTASSTDTSLSGAYWHPAYRSLVTKPFDPSIPESKAMIDAIRQQGWYHAFDTGCHVARSNSFWLSHLLFRPVGSITDTACICEWFAFQVYPTTNAQGQKTDTEFVATVRSKRRSVFTRTGIAMFEGFWDLFPNAQRPIPSDVDKELETLDSKAEVWFAKVL